MIKFYAVEYWDGKNTTTGQPNPRTGRMSRACDLVIFQSRSERNEWIKSGRKIREAVTRANARQLFAGWSLNDFNEHIESLEKSYEAYNE